MPEWGNGEDVRANVDMESPAAGGRYLKINDYDENGPALHTINSNAGANARGLKVEGKSEMDGHLDIEGSINVTGAENGINGPDGQLWLGVSNVTDTVVISHDNGGEIRTLGNLRAMGGIDGDEGNLAIGATENTDDVLIGRVGRTCVVNSALQVGADEDDPALLDAALDDEDPRDLNIGTQNSTEDVTIGRNNQDVVINGDLIIGAGLGNAGIIDAQLDGAAARELKIGTQNSTADITIGRVDQDVKIADDLDVNGDLKVGPDNDAGKIDSGGTELSPQHLKIGNATTTKDIVLGRSGRTVDFNTQARMNGKGLVMNDAASVSEALSGCGLVFNSDGHNGGGASIDFYTEGVLRGWVDSNGFNNV